MGGWLGVVAFLGVGVGGKSVSLLILLSGNRTYNDLDLQFHLL